MSNLNKAKINEVFQRYSEITDPAIRALILLILENNWGEAYEKEVYEEKQGKKFDEAAATAILAEEVWNKIEEYSADIVNSNPEQAFWMAITLICLPRHLDSTIDRRYQYLVGNMLTILTDERVFPYVEQFFAFNSTPQLPQVIKILQDIILDTEIQTFDKDKAFANPKFYNFFVALRLCALLGEDPRNIFTSMLSNLAYKKLKDDFVREQISWYMNDIPALHDSAKDLLLLDVF